MTMRTMTEMAKQVSYAVRHFGSMKTGKMAAAVSAPPHRSSHAGNVGIALIVFLRVLLDGAGTVLEG